MRLAVPTLSLVGLIATSGITRAQQPEVTTSDTTTGRSGARLKTALLITGGYWVAAFPVMERVWYRDQKRVAFHFFNDNKAYLQVDKFGHAFGAYVQSYAGYHGLRKSGLSRRGSLIYGGGLGLMLQTPIEIMDGLHEGWGFSWGDMAANALGSGLVVGQALVFDEQIVKYKFSYWGSSYAPMANGYLGSTTLDRMLEDYNGHTYWFSIPISALARDNVPRWLSVAMGYGANGMIGEFANIGDYKGIPIPDTPRYRQYLLSLDVDWTKVDAKSPLLNRVFTSMSFVKLPFPALELDSRGRWRAHWLYY